MATSSARKITVEFIGNDKSLGKTADGVASKTSSLSSKMQSAGKVAGKALAGGALIAAAGLYKMGQAAAADETAAIKLATALRNNAGASDETIASTERWITAQGKALGVTDDELRPSLAKLVAATHDVGKAQEMAALAMDISAGSGKSLEAVSAALVKAQNGSVAGLTRLGIKTSESVKDTAALQAAQIALRDAQQDYNGALKEFGAGSKEAKTAAMKLEYRQTKYGEALGKTKKTTISADEAIKRLADTYKGQAAKAAETTAGKQKRLSVALSELGEEIGYRVLPAMLKLSAIGLKMVGWVEKNQTTVAILVGTLVGLAAVTWAVGAAVSAWTAVTKVWMAVTKTAAVVQWALNAAMTANPIGLVIVAVAALAAGLIFAYKKSETFRKIVDKAFSVVKAGGAAVLGFFKRNWPLLLAIITGPFGLAVYAVAKNWDLIKAGVSAVKGFVVDKFVALLAFFRGLPSRFAGAAVGMFDGVKNAFKDALNWIIGKWNDFEISMPAIDTHIPGVGTVGGFSLGTPNIPYLAKGGIVKATRGGTLALLGEGGHDEAVVPLSGPNARSMGGGNIVVNIHGALDPVAVGRQLEQILVKYAATMSRPLQVRTLS